MSHNRVLSWQPAHFSPAVIHSPTENAKKVRLLFGGCDRHKSEWKRTSQRRRRRKRTEQQPTSKSKHPSQEEDEEKKVKPPKQAPSSARNNSVFDSFFTVCKQWSAQSIDWPRWVVSVLWRNGFREDRPAAVVDGVREKGSGGAAVVNWNWLAPSSGALGKIVNSKVAAAISWEVFSCLLSGEIALYFLARPPRHLRFAVASWSKENLESLAFFFLLHTSHRPSSSSSSYCHHRRRVA